MPEIAPRRRRRDHVRSLSMMRLEVRLNVSQRARPLLFSRKTDRRQAIELMVVESDGGYDGLFRPAGRLPQAPSADPLRDFRRKRNPRTS